MHRRVFVSVLELAGRSFQTVVLDSVDRRTGVTSTLWLDRRTGIVVQTRLPGPRLTYLAGPEVVSAVTAPDRAPDMSGAIMTPTNVTIRNVRAISFMKVRASMRPSGTRSCWLPLPGPSASRPARYGPRCERRRRMPWTTSAT